MTKFFCGLPRICFATLADSRNDDERVDCHDFLQPLTKSPNFAVAQNLAVAKSHNNDKSIAILRICKKPKYFYDLYVDSEKRKTSKRASKK
ncbi:hypothetical protein [Helicobacter sp. T3_23-1056]